MVVMVVGQLHLLRVKHHWEWRPPHIIHPTLVETTMKPSYDFVLLSSIALMMALELPTNWILRQVSFALILNRELSIPQIDPFLRTADLRFIHAAAAGARISIESVAIIERH